MTINNTLSGMFEHRTKIRTRYSEVDRMGYVYYGNYATYFEVGRVEAMRVLGISYAELEEQGIMMPVIRYEIDYRKPAFYDEELTIITRVRKVPRSRIEFEYETHNSKGDLLNSAMTELVFVDSRTMKPQRAPQVIVDAANKYLNY
jgi:acyl-CoA thioester hydrolase